MDGTEGDATLVTEDEGPGATHDHAAAVQFIDDDAPPPDHPPTFVGTATVTDMAPGPDLALALAGHTTPHMLPGVSGHELGELAAACQRLMSWAGGLRAAVVTELSKRPEMRPAPTGATFESVTSHMSTAAELADLLRLTSGQTEAVVADSVLLVEDLPRTHAALTSGVLTERQARVITDELRRHTAAVRDKVEDTVLGKPDTAAMHATKLRRRVKRAIHAIAPDEASQRRARSADDRYVKVTPAEDGMAWLEAFLPAETAMAVKATLDAAAATLKRRDTAAGDPKARTVDQRRSDALAQLAWASLDTGVLGGTVCPACGREPRSSTDGDTHGAPHALGTTHGRPVAVHVTVPLTTLVGLDQQPGELAGYGPIPATLARQLSAAGVWQWVGTDPATEAVLDHGRTRYTPTTQLIEHVILRDLTCRAPGCTVPASRCELDHTVPYPHGPTAPGNLGPLCGKHHRLKHHTRWQVTQPSPGTFTWTSPTGRATTVQN